MDLREYIDDPEEMHRVAHAAMMSGMMFALPCRVTEDSKDGHVCSVQPTIKRGVTDPKTGERSYEDHPVHVDVPIHHMSGGGFTVTHPTKKDDEGIAIYASRHIDAWHQSGGTQQPMDDSLNDLGDVLYIPGVRSTPRKLSNVSQASSQVRTDDGQHFVDLHQTNGLTLSVKGGDHTVNVHPQNGITHTSKVAVTMHAPSLNHVGNLTLSPDPKTGQGGNLTISSLNGQGGNLTVAQAITAQTMTAPQGKVGV